MSESKEVSSRQYSTNAIHVGQEFDQWTHAEIVPPIVTSMTFYQKDPTTVHGYCYCRDGNPTRDSLERCLANLDNGKHALVFPSGCAATTAVITLLKSGDHIVCCNESYGGTRTLFIRHAKMTGIEVDFVDATDVNQVKKAIKPNTKLIWLETPSNPCLKITDIEAVSKVAHSSSHDIILAVDNTLLTSYFQKPLDLGADIVIHSLTKYINGHNDVLAGALIINDEKIYEDIKYIQTKYGLISSPFDCYLINRSLKTLALRMKQHCENGLAVARFLEKQPNVLKTIHPGLPSHPQYELAKKQSTGHCGMVAVTLKGTIEEAKNFIQSLRLFLSASSLGSYASLVSIPAHSSHINLPEELREQLGIHQTTIRVSVGLEDAADLIADLDQALKKSYA